MKYWDGILVPIVLPFLQQRKFDHVFQHAWQCKMSRGSCLARLYEPETHPYSSLIGSITESVDLFANVKIHRKNYRTFVTYLCTSGTTSRIPLSNEWLVLCVGDVRLLLLREVVTHVTELRTPPYCMTISVCPWFVLIMMLRNFVDIALFVMPIWI
jgi:hypothetical protein